MHKLRWTVSDGGEHEKLAPVGQPYSTMASVVHHAGFSNVFVAGTNVMHLRGGTYATRRRVGRVLAEAIVEGVNVSTIRNS